MPSAPLDPLDLRSQADGLLQEAGERLHQMLREAVQYLDPFPSFPGAFFTLGIEVEPPEAMSRERGCVVLAPNGDLYELVIGQDLEAMAQGITDPVELRTEELKVPENFHPREYILYAHTALMKVLELIQERRAGRS